MPDSRETSDQGWTESDLGSLQLLNAIDEMNSDATLEGAIDGKLVEPATLPGSVDVFQSP